MSLARPGAPVEVRQSAGHPAGQWAAGGLGRDECSQREAGRFAPSEGFTSGSRGGPSEEGSSVHVGSF